MNSNSAWEQNLQTNVGTITLLNSPRNAKSKLRKPYDYLISLVEFQSISAKLKDYCDPFRRTKLQCVFTEVKAITYGRRFSFFALGYRPQFTGDTSGITEQEWSEFTFKVTTILSEFTSPEQPQVYTEPWDPTCKFQFRFESYFMLKELNP